MTIAQTRPQAAAAKSALLSALLASSAGACIQSDPPAATRSPPVRHPSKAKLFGDAKLVPTAEGERARSELALESAIRQFIEPLEPVVRVEVAVVLAPTRAWRISTRARPGQTDTAARAEVALWVNPTALESISDATSAAVPLDVDAIRSRVERLLPAPGQVHLSVHELPRSSALEGRSVVSAGPSSLTPRLGRLLFALVHIVLGIFIGLVFAREYRKRRRARARTPRRPSAGRTRHGRRAPR